MIVALLLIALIGLGVAFAVTVLQANGTITELHETRADRDAAEAKYDRLDAQFTEMFTNARLYITYLQKLIDDYNTIVGETGLTNMGRFDEAWYARANEVMDRHLIARENPLQAIADERKAQETAVSDLLRSVFDGALASFDEAVLEPDLDEIAPYQAEVDAPDPITDPAGIFQDSGLYEKFVRDGICSCTNCEASREELARRDAAAKPEVTPAPAAESGLAIKYPGSDNL